MQQPVAVALNTGRDAGKRQLPIPLGWLDSRFQISRKNRLGAAFCANYVRNAGTPNGACQHHTAAPNAVITRPPAPARLYQSDLLARAIAPQKHHGDLLYRTRDTPPQSALGLSQRLDNLADAFAVRNGGLAQLRGAHVTTIDDVMTSGASLSGACRALRDAGAARVDAWVFARAE